MSNQLVIGYGEIGKAVGKNIGEHDFYDLARGGTTGDSYEILHICFPFSGVFVDDVRFYIDAFKSEHVIIWSTVQIGTTKQILGAVHSPVEGKHPDLAMSISIMQRWIGLNDSVEGLWWYDYFKDLGLQVKLVTNSDHTEALKLLSTTEYGVNIEFARYKQHVADKIGMDYELTKDWNIEYNRLYKGLMLDNTFQKYVLDAPDGPKGGHCVTPNARLLDKQFPSELTKIVGEL